MKLLIVDDNEDVITSLKTVFEDYEILEADSIASAKRVLDLECDTIDIALLDMRLGEEDGTDLLKHIKNVCPSIECIMISGYSSVEKAVMSIKLGAFDFVEKPISYQKIKVVLNNALEHKRFSTLLRKEMDRYRMVGKSPAIKKLNELIEKAAQTDFPVLIMGESGVGKEHIANLIHLKSRRGVQEMVKLNCAAIPENLFESEFFGYEKGAFTGASAQKKGKIEQANGGTLFMDEIGELPLSQQAKLLRVLEDREVTRVGGDKKLKVDFRLICATNRDLKEAAQKSQFREDLYYRIGVLVIEVPPLRDRKDDIPLLAEHFFREACADHGSVMKTLSPDSLEYIASLPLRGNIRELKNMMQRIFAFAEGMDIHADMVKKILAGPQKNPEDSIFQKTMNYPDAKHLLEKIYIETQLRLFEGNISKTALAIGLLPNNLSRKMKELGIVQ